MVKPITSLSIPNSIRSMMVSMDTIVKQLGEDIKTVVSSMNSMGEMASVKGLPYKVRHELVEAKLKCLQFMSTVNRELKIERKNNYESYKFGKKDNKECGPLVLKNETERSLYIDYDVKEYDFAADVLSSQLEWLNDSIKTIDRVLYGIEHLKTLENFDND